MAKKSICNITLHNSHVRCRMYAENGMVYICRTDTSFDPWHVSTIIVGELDPFVVSKGYQMMKNYL